MITVHRVYDYYYCYCTITVTVTVSSQYSSNMEIDYLTELNNNVNGQVTLELEKLMEESVCILGGPRIQVAQPTEGSTAGFLGDD